MTQPISSSFHQSDSDLSPDSAANPPVRPSSEEIARLAARMGDQYKAEEIRVLDIADASIIADYFVLMTGFNRRQIQNISWEIDREMKLRGANKLGLEGYETAWWVLLDYGDVVIHIFHADARHYYDLDMLWGDTTEFDWRGDELVPIHRPDDPDAVDATYEPATPPAPDTETDDETAEQTDGDGDTDDGDDAESGGYEIGYDTDDDALDSDSPDADDDASDADEASESDE